MKKELPSSILSNIAIQIIPRIHVRYLVIVRFVYKSWYLDFPCWYSLHSLYILWTYQFFINWTQLICSNIAKQFRFFCRKTIFHLLWKYRFRFTDNLRKKEEKQTKWTWNRSRLILVFFLFGTTDFLSSMWHILLISWIINSTFHMAKIAYI